MSTKNLTAVTNELIESYGNTAKNVINAYRVGNERAVDFVTKGFVTAVEKAGSTLSIDLQDKAVSAQKSIASMYTKGVEVTSKGADSAVNKVVELAIKSLDQIASNSERLEKALGANTLNALVDAALPAAEAVSKVAAKLEAKSGDLVNNIAGSKAKVKVATVKRAVTKKAAAVRKAAPKASAKVAKKVEAEVAAA